MWLRCAKMMEPGLARSFACAAIAAATAVLSGGCAVGPKVPPALQVPTGQTQFLHAYARGVQFYISQPSSNHPGGFDWKLKAPEAMLFDGRGSVIGSHYAGPTWQSDHDGSKVSGAVVQLIQSPRSNAIPWLLLRARAHADPGCFQRVSYIQRVNTDGGLPPQSPPGRPNQEARVPYTGEYFFYRESR